VTAAPATRSTRTDSTTTTSTARRGSTTPQEQAARRQAQKLAEVHAQLADAVAAAATDAGWRAWLSTAAKFRSYAPANQCLILLQRPSATRVAGYRVWQGLNRQVRKGEQSIRILAPIRRRVTADTTPSQPTPQPTPGIPIADPTADDPGQRGQRVLTGFTVVSIFDISQTEGAPLPEIPAVQLLEGEASAGLWAGLVSLVEARGFTVTREDPAPAWGVTRYTDRRVDIAPSLSPAMACHTLAHELGHVAADHETRRDVPRGVREAEADGIAYLLTTAAGLSGHFTVDYVTGWTGGDAGVVRATQARVVTTAGALLDALGYPTPTAPRSGETAGRGSDRLAGGGRGPALRPPPGGAVGAVGATGHAGTATDEGNPMSTSRRPAAGPDSPLPAAEVASLRAVLEEAAAWYRAQLLAPSSAAVGLLRDRGLVDLAEDTPIGLQWQVGHAPASPGCADQLVTRLRDLGHADPDLLAAGVAMPGRGGGLVDVLRDRLVVPLRDHAGVVGFTGRRLDDTHDHTPKWLNTPTTPLYRKGGHVLGLVVQADLLSAQRGRVVLVEGPFDAIAIHLAGDIGLAAGGTALTADHAAQLLAVTGPDRPLHVAYDPDPAGRTATVRAAHLFGGYPAVEVLLPAGQDPADLLLAAGARGLRRALGRTRPLVYAAVDDRLDRWAVHLAAGNVAAAVDAVRDVAPLITAAPIGQHAGLITHAATRTGLDPSFVTEVVLAGFGPTTFADDSM
jgi:DNA primase catalytic core